MLRPYTNPTVLYRLLPSSTALLVRFHFLRERTRHRARCRLGRGWGRLEPLRRLDLDLVVAVNARARRDEMADDDVLLQPQQVVPRAADRRVGQHPRGLLERRRRNERLRRQARLGDPQEQRLVGRGLAALLHHAVLRVGEGLLIHVLPLQELRGPGLDDLHLLQHLADDHADMLVVDLHALQPVHLLDLVEQILLHRPWALDPQNVVRVHRSLGKAVAGAHAVALVHAQVLTGRHLVQLRLPLLGVDVDLALAALDLAEPHGAVDLGDRRRILGPPGLEQLGHARQAARDVARLVRLARHLREHEPGVHFLAVLHGELRPFGDDEVAQPLFLLALLLDDLDVRVQLLLPVLDDHPLAPPRELVQLLAHRLLLDDVHEPYHAPDVRHDRVGVGVPGEQHRVARHLGAVQHHQRGAERHVEARVHRELPPGLAMGRGLEDQLALVARHDLLLLRRLDENQPVAVLDHAFDLGLPHRLLGDARRRAADVEGPQRELRARLADRLRGQNADGLAQVHHVHRGEVAAVAHPAHAALRLARQDRADLHRLDPRILDGLRGLFDDELARLDQHLGAAVFIELVWIHDLFECHAADYALAQRLDDVFTLLQRRHLKAEDRAAIFFCNGHVLRDVHQPARQIAGVGRLERRVGETLPRAVRRDEVLEHRQPFAEVRLDRALDDFADAASELLLRLRHQPAHTGELPDLVARAAAAGVEHHEHRVEAALGLPHRRNHRLGDVVVRVRPGVDHLVIALAERDLAGRIRALEPLDAVFRVVEQRRLLGRNLEIGHADRDAANGRVAEAELLQLVEELHRRSEPRAAVALEHQLGEILLPHHLVLEAELAQQSHRDDAVEDHSSRRRRDPAARQVRTLVPHLHGRVELEPLHGEPHLQLRHRADARRRLELLLEVRRLLGQEVTPQHHVLAGLRDRPAVGRFEDVVRRNHQQPRFELRLERERHVHRHLVAVEVRVERRADERMDPDGLTLDEHRLERLNAQSVQRRRAVQQYRMVLDDLLEDLVHFRRLLLHDLLRPLHRLGNPLLHQLVDDEWLEQFDRHCLGQAALVQPQLGADYDDRPARVVDALAEQVLPEPALLALQHVGQRLQRPLAASANRLGAPAVVEQRVHRLLQHPLLVAENDLRRAVQDQLLQPVVPVDHPPVQIVQVGRGKAPAVERHQRPQVGRNHRHDVENQPARIVALLAGVAGVAHRVHDLEPLQHLLLAMLARLVCDGVAQFVGELVDVDPLQQQTDRGRTDVGPERRVALGLRLVAQLQEAVLVQQLPLLHFLLARLDHHVVRVVDDALEVAQRHVEQVAHRRRQRLEEPDVRHRHRQLDVPHPLAPHLGQRNLDAAAIADHAAIADPLVLAAVALPVLYRTEDALAKEPIPFGLEGAVVDRLGLGDLAPRPPRALALQLQALALLGVLGPPNLLRRGDPDLDIVKAGALGLVAPSATEIDHLFLHVFSSAVRHLQCERLELLHQHVEGLRDPGLRQV